MKSYREFKKQLAHEPSLPRELPAVLTLKRVAMRQFPGGHTVGLYQIEQLGVIVPFPLTFKA